MTGSSLRLTAAQALIAYLGGQNVERDGRVTPFFGPVLGIFGHGNVGGIGEALEGQHDRVRFMPFRNEQAMVHAAAGYAWMHRRLGALACTTSVGPGATNMVTGAAGATINRLPVLLLPGDIFAGRSARPVLQELESRAGRDVSVNDTLRPVSRFWTRIMRPEQLLDALPEALRVLTSPAETGAVTIALPQDTQTEAYAWPESFLRPRTWHVPRGEPEPQLADHVARLIAAAERPMIVAGGGVRYSAAENDLAEFAEEFALPVALTQAGRSTLAHEHPMNLGAIGATGGLAANRYAADADLVIALGTRLGDFTTASGTTWSTPGVRFVAINVDAADAHKVGAIAVVADARQALRALSSRLRSMDGPGTPRAVERTTRVNALRSEWDALATSLTAPGTTGSGRPTQAQLIAAVNEFSGSSGTIISAAGSMPGDLHKLWRSATPDDYHVEYGYSCMGYEIAGGLGVKLAEPAREVVVLVGDGSYLMMNSEIVTAVEHGLRLTVVVVDSHGYRSISALASSLGARNDFNLLATPVDYRAHAQSMGAHAVRAETLAELRAALDGAREFARTTVVVVEVDPANEVPSYGWWDVPVAEVSSSAAVVRARAAYERARAASGLVEER
ncbi:MAG TPA: 3D-(3,5/4)-trihydroxycyclohexane-1,2-dione acylhydrolase (decyclizing) [Candidatus Limnocylindrales bacterium]|nr:3D-(3,5/4)-trihydroxycyclohexane-1,2-dione acylhydrolase (decyclizing) [Candidatus Limnocylindrales bacterium]